MQLMLLNPRLTRSARRRPLDVDMHMSTTFLSRRRRARVNYHLLWRARIGQGRAAPLPAMNDVPSVVSVIRHVCGSAWALGEQPLCTRANHHPLWRARIGQGRAAPLLMRISMP